MPQPAAVKQHQKTIHRCPTELLSMDKKAAIQNMVESRTAYPIQTQNLMSNLVCIRTSKQN